MGVIECQVFKIDYIKDSSQYEQNILVLADNIEEALNIFREKYPKFIIKGVHTYMPIIRKTTKTVTISL